MTKILNIETILKTYNSSWILLENPTTDRNLKIKSGKLIFNSKNRDEVYQKARELSLAHTAIIFTGKSSMDNTAIIL